MQKPDEKDSKTGEIVGKVLLILLVILLYPCFGVVLFFMALLEGANLLLVGTGLVLVPVFMILLILLKKRKIVSTIGGVILGVNLIAVGVNIGMIEYRQKISIDTSPNIDVYEYLPFDKESNIVTLGHEASLKLEKDLPIVDGAAAVFPVYSAFVNATYPDTVELDEDVFQYNNTVAGYEILGQKETDIFFGAYPSDEQIEAARKEGTEFEYTEIGKEAFVFFVHKDNPVNSLSTEQIQAIYSGKITNWKEVGGKNEKIEAFQRNEGSGSQSMLIRFMDGKEIMDAPKEKVTDLMSGIVEQVADYKSKSNSIGFSFRYYIEGIIQNPNIKILQVDGVSPSVENIKNDKYAITTPLYAVTYKGNENKNVDKLLQWVLSDEGQEIIEKTGYVGVKK